MVLVELILLINGVRYSLPLPEDAEFPVSINRSIVDWESVGQRRGDFSKTIKVQGNQETNIVLRHLFLATISQDENKVKSLKGDTINVPCELNVNGIPHITGYCLIRSATSTDLPDFYELAIFSGMNDWADRLAKLNLRELGLGRTTWSYPNILASNQQDKSEASNLYNHVYPLIEYGDIGNKPYAGNAIMDYELRAAPFIRDMVIAAFTKVGYTITSDFFDNDDIRRLVYPFTSGNWKRSAAVYQDYYYRANWNATQTIISSSSHYTLRPNTEVSDVKNQGVLSTAITVIPPPLFSSAPTSLTGFKFTAAEGGTMTIRMTLSVTMGNNIAQVWLHQGTPNMFPLHRFNDISYLAGSTQSVVLEADVYLTAGENYSICFWPLNNNAINILSGSKIEFIASENIEIGGEYDIANTLPDRPAMEFIQGLTQLFNLVFDTDPLARTIRIESMFSWVDSTGANVDGFYLGTSDAVDYSNKVQQHEEFKIDFLSSYKRRLIWKYKDDSSDGILVLRGDKTPHIYGSYYHDLYKRFQKGEQKYENAHFSPTYMGYRKIGGAGGYTQVLLVPVIMGQMTSGYDQPTYSCEPRILMHKYSDHDSFFPGSSGLKHYEWKLKDSLFGTSYGFSTDCPRVFSVDIDGEVNFSLNFGNLDVNGGIDTYGLFWRFWSKVPPFLNEGVKATGQIKYLEIDNLNLNFRKLWYVNDVYWIVNKVIDYKPQTYNFTKVELLLKSELGKASMQTQENGIDGWANPFAADTSGEVLDFNIDQDEGIFTTTGDVITVILGKGPSIGSTVTQISTTKITRTKKVL
jgi:hypothetical protein